MVLFARILIAICIYLQSVTGGILSGIEIPAECDGKEFCDIKPRNYHVYEKRINELLNKYNIKSLTTDLDDRVGKITKNVKNVSDNCPVHVRESKPVIKVNRTNTTLTNMDIFVQTRIVSQTVSEVTCDYTQIKSRNGNEECFSELDMSNFWNFNCQQEYAIRSLLVYDPQRDRIVNKSYTIPVCCSCQITYKSKK